MYRLVDLLSAIKETDRVRNKLALKGGTALQLFFFDLSRLSIDVDLNYIGSIDREVMLEDRRNLTAILKKLFNQKGYTIRNFDQTYALDQFHLAYDAVAGNTDVLKVEINYLERLPLDRIEDKKLLHRFEPLGEVEFPTYIFEEHMAMKTRALMTRATPRDLFDVFRMLRSGIGYDGQKMRKYTLFYLLLSSTDIRSIEPTVVLDITGSDVRSNLVPLLSRDSRDVDLEVMKETVGPYITNICTLSEKEKEMVTQFYNRGIYEHKLLFEDIGTDVSLELHPGLVWRLMNIIKGLENR